MLDGVTLLHTFEQTTGGWLVVLTWIGFILLALVTVYAWIVTANRRTRLHLIVSLIVTLLCLLCLVGTMNVETKTETLYKVTVDSTVSYREFTYYYEVLDVEGEIYTIREIPEIENNETEPVLIKPTSPITQPTENEPDPTWDFSVVE